MYMNYNFMESGPVKVYTILCLDHLKRFLNIYAVILKLKFDIQSGKNALEQSWPFRVFQYC